MLAPSASFRSKMRLSRIVLALVMVVLLVLGAVWWRATWVVNHLLHGEAPRVIAEKSGDVYRLDVGRVRFRPLRRRIIVDAIHLTTNQEVNAGRPRPRTALRLEFQNCTLAGMHLFTLIAGRGLIAESFGCADIRAAAQVPPPAPAAADQPDSGVAPTAVRQAFFVLQHGLRLPEYAPRVQVARIDFPHAALDLRVQWARGQMARLELEHLEWHMVDFAIDPADSGTTSRPLFSRKIDVAAANFVARTDSGTTALRVAGFAANHPDSTVEILGIMVAPPVSDSAFARASPYRRSLLKANVGRVVARGLDVGALALGAGLRARRVQVDSLHVDVLSDRRRPPNPRRPIRRTPQQWVADLERNVIVDSVLVRGGEVIYREQRQGHPKPGVLTFARLDATAVNVRHVAGRAAPKDLMTLRATAYVQDVGRLTTRFVAPLDAPSFDMKFDGTLGAMPVTSLNAFIEKTFAVRFDKGRNIGISFDASVTSGVATGSVTPRYKDLSLDVTGRGSKGILAAGGVVGDAARGIATMVENLTDIRQDNPAEGETEPRRGLINHTFTPDTTLPAFLWQSLRGGLMAVLRH